MCVSEREWLMNRSIDWLKRTLGSWHPPKDWCPALSNFKSSTFPTLPKFAFHLMEPGLVQISLGIYLSLGLDYFSSVSEPRVDQPKDWARSIWDTFPEVSAHRLQKIPQIQGYLCPFGIWASVEPEGPRTVLVYLPCIFIHFPSLLSMDFITWLLCLMYAFYRGLLLKFAYNLMW